MARTVADQLVSALIEAGVPTFTSRAVVAADRDTGRAIPAGYLCTRNCARSIAFLIHTDNG